MRWRLSIERLSIEQSPLASRKCWNYFLKIYFDPVELEGVPRSIASPGWSMKGSSPRTSVGWHHPLASTNLRGFINLFTSHVEEEEFNVFTSWRKVRACWSCQYENLRARVRCSQCTVACVPSGTTLLFLFMVIIILCSCSRWFSFGNCERC